MSLLSRRIVAGHPANIHGPSSESMAWPVLGESIGNLSIRAATSLSLLLSTFERNCSFRRVNDRNCELRESALGSL
jgi:hypothetical protein